MVRMRGSSLKDEVRIQKKTENYDGKIIKRRVTHFATARYSLATGFAEAVALAFSAS